VLPRVDPRHFGLTTVGDAYALLEHRQAQGKVVIDIAL
jgi:hypothetical protein